jgi:hypothetical protein
MLRYAAANLDIDPLHQEPAMQHIHTPTFQFDGHNRLWRTVVYISTALAALVALYEHSIALLALMAVAFVLVLALSERATRLQSRSPAALTHRASGLVGDGGSFPGSAPETAGGDSGTTRVLDGGSLERHRF